MRTLFERNDTPATVLNLALNKLFGSQFYNWELETIWSELMTEFKLPDLNKFNRDKIGALVTLNTTDMFYWTWEAFEKIGSALTTGMYSSRI